MGVLDMRRKKVIFFGVGAFLLLVGLAGTLLWALLRVPDFYLQAASTVPREPEQRKLAAKQLVQETTNLINSIKHAEQWSAAFKQTDVNSWFLEELRQEKYQDIIPEGVSDPRLVIHEGLLQLGFRYHKNGWSGIVSLRLKPWIEGENQLAVEIQSIHAGIVPIPLEDMLRELSLQLVKAGWDITWDHAQGNDVAVINLNKQPNPKSPILESLTVAEGEVRVRGRRKDFQPEPAQHNYPRTAANR
jgi:hypothetical protein